MATPVIDGERVVCVYYKTIYAWTVGTSAVETLVPQLETNITEVVAQGPWVVYVKATPDSFLESQLFAYNTTTQTTTLLSDGLADRQGFLDLEGDKVVWERHTVSLDANRDAYVYDLTTNVRTHLGEGPTAEPRISGSRICFHLPTDDRSRGDGIQVLDLATSTVTTLGATGAHCDIDGTRVAWTDALYSIDAYFVDLVE
jgi:hypothetical protein